jgi:putative DNA primase/helicase
MGSAAAIARQLGGTRQGHNWRCLCPRDCGYSLSLTDSEDGRLLAFCFGGCEFSEVMPALVEYGLLDDDDGDASQVSRRVTGVSPSIPLKSERIAHARQIYDSGVYDERIAAYLRSRKIGMISPVLRFHEQAPHRLGARLPAMLAPVVNVIGEQTGVHMTYLRCDGCGKADLPKEHQRECRGGIHGGAIRLAEHDPNAELIIGEGIESTLSAMQLFDRAGWAAVYAGGLKALELPSTIRAVIIAADNDVSRAGQRNALAAYDRWAAEGRSVLIKTPPDIGDDFNDALIKRRNDARPQ